MHSEKSIPKIEFPIHTELIYKLSVQESTTIVKQEFRKAEPKHMAETVQTRKTPVFGSSPEANPEMSRIDVR